MERLESLQNAENSSLGQGSYSSSTGKENCKASRKRKHSVTDKNGTVTKLLIDKEGSNDVDFEFLAENFSYEQCNHSSNPYKGNCKTSRKRKYSVTDKDDTRSKRPHMNKECSNYQNSKFLDDLQHVSRHSFFYKLHNTCQTNRYISHCSLQLMYQLDLSVLCSLRKSMYKYKYPLLSLMFQDSAIDKFCDIALHYKGKSIHIQVENVDNYIDSNISYARLFNKERRSSSINSYFDSFVKHVISKSNSLYDVEYLIVYTNSGLDLTEEKELRKGRCKNFYPFKFYSINVEQCDILKDFLFTRNNIQEAGFYQFSHNKIMRKELLKQLKFSPAVQKVVKKRELSQKFKSEIKEAFLDKLVFAVNQPNRAELAAIIKREMKNNKEILLNYMTFQKKILSYLEKHTKLGSYISGIIYEFNLLMLFFHDMFLRKNMFSINFEGKSCDISNYFIINYKGKTIYLKAHYPGSDIDYSQLFPSKQKSNAFSINKLFALFVKKLG
ncbi:unnamed protein product, partial [Larinioides sclopetarius]